MANDSEFCIPLHFLNDDDTNFDDAISRSLLSPVESFPGSTESDEEERLTELTRRMAHSTLASEKNSKVVFGSPQSTLESCAKGASPNGGVLCHANSNQATWDLLRAAAGEVERMHLEEREAAYGVLRHTGKSSPGVGFYPNQQRLQIAQFEMMRRQQLARQQLARQQQEILMYGNWVNPEMVPNRGRNDDVLQRSLGLSASAWPSLQYANQQPQFGCGMTRPVFPGNKKERNGTGVFLPSFRATAEARKKLACSSAMVQDRVAHALNVKCVVGGYKQQKNRVNGTSNIGNASTTVSRRNKSDNGFSQQKRTVRTQPPANHEIKLPQEWTY